MSQPCVRFLFVAAGSWTDAGQARSVDAEGNLVFDSKRKIALVALRTPLGVLRKIAVVIDLAVRLLEINLESLEFSWLVIDLGFFLFDFGS